jgi:ribulose-5-phosphate 4-epimerase/fuculose-1-phosphate aldolase
MIYEIFPQAAAVVHVHNNSHWQQLLGAIPTTSPAVPYGTPAMAQEILRLANSSTLPADRILAMAGHEDGILAFGPSLAEAIRTLRCSISLVS